MPEVQHKRGTRSALDALAAANNLLVGQVYVITDEDRLAVATGVGSYQAHQKEGESLTVLDLGSTVEHTIATGAITATASNIVLRGEGGGSAADDLDTITKPTDSTAAMVTLKIAGGAGEITIKDNTGNINLPDTSDVVLSGRTDSITLLWNQTAGKWFEIARTLDAEAIAAPSAVQLSGLTATTFANASTTDLDWDTTDFADTGFSVSSGVITVGSELNGKRAWFSANVTITLANRSEVYLRLQLDSGSGYADVAVSANYTTRDANQNNGSASLSGYGRELATGDKYKVQLVYAQDGDTAAVIDVGCWFSIRTDT